MSEHPDLQADEGVNEGSAASTDEERTDQGQGVSGALAAASESGRPKGESDPAPPVGTGLPQTRSDTDDQVGPGQELSAGEG